MDPFLSALLDREVAGWPGPAAVMVVDADGVVAHGGADSTYAWASVTKVLTALAILDSVRHGVLALDEPAGPPGATLRHLLAHASGLAMDDPSRILAAPGRRRIYSNAGIEVAASLLEERTGSPWVRVVTETVLDPLAMSGTRLGGSPAHGAGGPVADLARLAVDLLRPRVLDPWLVASATAVAFADLSGVLPGFGRQDPNPWGLGPELRGHKSPHWTAPEGSPRTFGHFGQSGSLLWVDPDAGLACVSAGATAFGPWAAQAWPRLATAVLSARSR